MNHEFKRVAIVNRGEAAMRFIHAAREFNQEHGSQLRTIALFTESDRLAMFVREADEAVALGPARCAGSDTPRTSSGYADFPRLKSALVAAHAEAAWLGWGLVSEQERFADLCRELGILFIGPSNDILRQVGDRIAAKLLAEKIHVPVVPWSHGPVETVDDARRHAHRLGYPLLIKSAVGSGVDAVRRVCSSAELGEAFASVKDAAFAAFGNSTVFLEKASQGARQLEVQIIADVYGTTWALGVRDCTIQKENKKILAEAPAPKLPPGQERALRQAAVQFSLAARYENAGTVKFLYHPATRRFAFLEMSAGLQAEHSVTECCIGLDLVKLQIYLARGGRLQGNPPITVGHAVEVRLKAEVANESTGEGRGRVERLRMPGGPGIRIDSGVAEGDTVPREFDPVLSQLIACGRDRAEAMSRLKRALRDTLVVVKGGSSNKPLLLEILGRPEVQNAQVDTGWLDRVMAASDWESQRYADVALLAAAIESYEAAFAVEQKQFYASAARLRPDVRREVGRTVELAYRGHSYCVKTRRIDWQRYLVTTGDSSYEVILDQSGSCEYWLNISGNRFHIVSTVEGVNHQIEVNGVSHRITRGDDGIVYSSSPAVVVTVAVTAGDTVAVGDRLAVLEAMKMEMPVLSPFSGKIRQVMIIPNVQVEAGAPLIQIDPSVQETGQAAENGIVFGASFALRENTQATGLACIENLEAVRRLILGFDLDPALCARHFSEWARTCPADSKEIRRAEDEILSIFVDICSLFHRQPEVDEDRGGETPSSEAYLFSYLRRLDTRGEGLPGTFIDALSRALRHYGLRSLAHSAQLEDSLLCICKSHQRMDQQVNLIQGLLERRLQQVSAGAADFDQPSRILLDRLILISGDLFPGLSDLAREVRYRLFDQPQFEGVRKKVYAEMEEQLAYLRENPAASDRQLRIRAMVECPQPLVSFLCEKFVGADSATQLAMLEVLTLRHYRIRTLMGFRSWMQDGHCFVAAEYDLEGKRIHVFTTYADYIKLDSTSRVMLSLLQDVPSDHEVVLDFYAWQPCLDVDPEVTQEEVSSLLNRAGLPGNIRRVVVGVGHPNNNHGTANMQFFTYRFEDRIFAEDKLFRGIHPMMAKRLHLWRLSNFKIQRLPSVEDVYLLHAVARENPKDERLFACAEVRDLTPVRDELGKIVQLPHLERMLMEAVTSVRVHQSHRKPQERLHWNRILLYVWPEFDLSAEDLRGVMEKLSPALQGLGLEQLILRTRIPHSQTGELQETIIRISSPAGAGLLITYRLANHLQPIKPLSEYEQKVVRMRQRGFTYPYEIIRMLTPVAEDTHSEFPPGDFVEHDLDPQGHLTRVERPYGKNHANVIVGIIRNYTARYPEGITRVLLMGDPGKDLGAIAEPECRRILTAIDLAERMRVPVEWFPISAGAKISMESGVENMDWIARVLRRLIEFTQAGGEVNIVVNGINVGAQPYWNAEATMLMHTRGILVMTSKAAMVLTGKRALDFSGSISAEDNQGIGGYDRIMGGNGQAQYWAQNIDEACHVLMQHYEHTYVAPGERFPRRAETSDPVDRNVQLYPHGNGHNSGFARVGDIFSDETNPGRKKPFDIRKVMLASIDQDHPPLERWAGMRGAETAVVWDAHLGGYPVCLIGIESRLLPRLGFTPADGPEQWTSGTLFPLSSKKVARALNAASNNRPVVLLANLSGFDGSPESMRKLQLEYGAEIGRAVVNFKGPMIFCVISRYHGGAYVVFSQALNEQLEVVALEGTYASVIGGAPAAAVVFAGEVEARTRKDARLLALNEAIDHAEPSDKKRLREQWETLFRVIHSEKLGEVADEFDHVHSVQRALKVGALRDIIPPANLRPYLINAIERTIAAVEISEGEKSAVVPETEVEVAA